jgi:hypothetical protein
VENRVGICIGCEKKRNVNFKGLCSDCVFRRNHEGKSRFEVYQNRAKLKVLNEDNSRTNKLYNSRKKVKKTTVKNDKNNLLQLDEEVYFKVFSSRPSFCEECGKGLPDQFRDDDGKVIARWQYSHILSKGAYKELRHNESNFQRLCFQCHQIYEFGDRTKMKTYNETQKIIELLYEESRRLRTKS